MPIFKLEIPVSDYYSEEAALEPFYFESANSPSKEQICAKLHKLHEMWSKDSWYRGLFKEAAEMVALWDDFPNLSIDNGLICSSGLVIHPKFGPQPIWFSLIDVTKLE